uniref:AB hydrolase-1 domain-containing protein n=1 Tax=Eutreptiella gymnastica TaxID=73025 RepID=A0A7S1IVZ9_9EUGL|mmetsp:Transcript_47715/g.85207  ORF Transcript_47715/g.85207 Transcript_47715/m.85207 type:complete len:336 (+) Transcript_47715:27-1034(+)
MALRIVGGQVRLRDGRALAFREYGADLGLPIIFTHGNLNSRLFEPVWDLTQEMTANTGVRIVAVDRPGYGDSTFHEGRTYTSWAHDVRELVDALELPRFAVLGFSSGGPHALACAAHKTTLFANRLLCCGLIASDGPYWLLGPDLYKYMFAIPQSTAMTKSLAIPRCTQAEQRLRESYTCMAKEERRTLALRDLDHAIKNGLDGPAQDALLESSDWALPLHRLACPVWMWHGQSDDTVPPEAAWGLLDLLHRSSAPPTPCPAPNPDSSPTPSPASNPGPGFACSPSPDPSLSACRGGAQPPIHLELLEGESHSLIRRHWGAILHRMVLLSETARL